MTNNDFLKISELLDVKLEPIREVQTKMQETQNDMQIELREVKSELKNDIHELRTELKDDINEVRTEMNELRTELKGDINGLRTELKVDINGVRTEMNELRSELKGDIDKVSAVQTQTELLLENDVIPRLQNIEACYTDAYDRYSGSVAEVRTLKTDIGIMKKVIIEHTEKLKTL